MDRHDIARAEEFAARAHAGQTRKGSNTPYIDHPLRVARMLEEHGASPEAIIAALLHDTAEDTSITQEDIQREFGEKIASIVAGASEPDKSLPWEERKEGTIRRLRSVSFESALVSAADKIDNLRSTVADLERIGEDVWRRFNRGRDKQEWYHRECLESLRTNPCGIAEHPLADLLEEEIHRAFGEGRAET